MNKTAICGLRAALVIVFLLILLALGALILVGNYFYTFALDPNAKGGFGSAAGIVDSEYTRWLLKRFEEGYVLSRNPLFQHKVTRYELTPDQVDCVVFCSKNYAPILPHINSITERFHTYFHYTITAYGKEIEPGVPGIDESMATLTKLSEIVGANRIAWRYDPVLLTSEYTVRRHLETFERMASFLSGHIDRCIFSFVEMYRKLQTNMPELIPLTEKDKEELAAGLGAIAAKYKIPIQTCGTNGDYTRYGISSSGCMTLNILGQANGVQFRNLKHLSLIHI